jgi:hypothetical protein
MNEPNIVGFLRNIQRQSAEHRQRLPLLAIDENLNNDTVGALATSLVSQRKVNRSTPVWYKTRVSAKTGEVLFSIPGGVDRRTMQPNSFIPDLGRDKRGETWSDLRVVAALVGNLIYYDDLVLLSADLGPNYDGLGAILNRDVKPNLPEGCSLTVLFKDGHTDLDSYCRKVLALFESHCFGPSYAEHVL